MVTCPDSTNPLIAQPTTMTQDGKGTVSNANARSATAASAFELIAEVAIG